MQSIEKQMLYLLSRADYIEIQELIKIYEKQGYAASYVRNSLSRLKKEGYVVSPSRSNYQITDLGRAFVESINRKPARYSEQWDGNWEVVMLEVPEEERKKRDLFRSQILQYGFGLLYNSVYVSPWDYQQDVLYSIRNLGLEGKVSLFHGTFQEGLITRDKAFKIWKLDSLEQIYQEKLKWFQEDFKPSADRILNQDKNALDLFLLYLQLGEVISEMFLIDPMLPQELLPAEWAGQRILYQFFEEYDHLSNAIPNESSYAQFKR